jgi:hypothetical protein
MSEAYILCLNCRATFTEAQIKGWGCPTCGNKGVPGDTRKKATLTLTHHEWQILFMWADNWSAQCGRSDENFRSPMPSIMREAKRQAPELPGLSLKEEVQDVANAFGTVEIHDADGTRKVEPEKKH